MNNSDKIYVVTTVSRHDPISTRPWFFFFTFEKAEKVVINNHTDLNEAGYWPYVVIEELKEFSFTDRKEFWYEFDHETGKYVEITKPEKFKGIVCWGLG